MLKLLAPLLLLTGLASCGLLPPAPGDGSDTAGSGTGDTDDETATELAVVVIEPPGRCDQLLENLERTQPLIEQLDSRLADHVERLDAALERLDQPEPPDRSLACPEPDAGTFDDKEIIGAIEWLYMSPPGHHYRARVDSGAETSSLSAKDVIEFERDGDDWVRFTFEHDGSEEAVDFELPIVRTVLIRQPAANELERRVVVELDIRLGDRLQATEFTLTDRSRMTYPVLLGRAFLMDLYVIDIARSYTHPRYEVP